MTLNYISKQGIVIVDSLGIYYLFDMAFLYEINGKAVRFDDDFHCWYIYGIYPDPKLKQEIVEEKPMDEAKLQYSGRDGEGRLRSHSRNSWRR